MNSFSAVDTNKWLRGHMTRCKKTFQWFVFLFCLPVCTFVMMSATVGHADNIIPDPSFEAGTENWTFVVYNASSIDSTTARTGSNSLLLINDAQAAGKSHNVWQYNIPNVVGGLEYEYNVWVRGDNVTGVDAGGKPLAVIRWLGAGGNLLSTERYLWAPYGTYNWRQLKINLQAPADAAQVNIGFRSWKDCLTGTTHWDDVSLSPRDLSARGVLLGTYQAEDASSFSGGAIDTQEEGYTGSGYFFPDTANAIIEWDNIPGGTDGGIRILSFRYAIEGNPLNWELLVNGESQGIVKPSATGMLNSWASSDWEVTLQSGDNTVRLRVAQPTSGPFIDKLELYQKAGTPLPKVSTPALTPDGGRYDEAVTVSMETTTPGATIYYTVDGTTPDSGSTEYSEPFLLEGSATVSAIGIADGFADSAVGNANYIIGEDPLTAAAPTITPDGGAFTTSVEVTMETTTPGATIYYTLDGSTPDLDSNEYTAPFTINETTTVTAIAFAAGFQDSGTTIVDFTLSSSGGDSSSGCFIQTLR
jgi:hypothetical protein